MTEMAGMIESLGLPICMIIALCAYVRVVHKETIEMQLKQMETSDRAIKEAQDSNRELMMANKELLETNRTLVDGISVKVDVIENSILQIKKDVEKR